MSRQIELEVFASFKASHSLTGFETPHFHLWKLSACFSSPFPLKVDRVLDLVFLQNTLLEITDPIEGTHLNDSLGFSPTSENVAAWVWDQISHRLKKELQGGATLAFVKVSLCDLEGQPTGAATLRGST